MDFLKEVESAKKNNNEFISNISKFIITQVDDIKKCSSNMLYSKLLSWENYVENKIYYINFVKKFKELIDDKNQIDCGSVIFLYNFFELFLEVNKTFYDVLKSYNKSEITKDFILDIKERFIFIGFIDFIYENQKLTYDIYSLYKEFNDIKRIKFDFEKIRDNIINSLRIYIANNKETFFNFSNNFYKTYNEINNYFYDKYLLNLLHYETCDIIKLVNNEFSNVTSARMLKTIINTMLSGILFKKFITIIKDDNSEKNVKLVLHNIININKYVLSYNIKNEMVDIKPLIEVLYYTLQIIKNNNVFNNINLFIE